jgi:hypothetical protein
LFSLADEIWVYQWVTMVTGHALMKYGLNQCVTMVTFFPDEKCFFISQKYQFLLEKWFHQGGFIRIN